MKKYYSLLLALLLVACVEEQKEQPVQTKTTTVSWIGAMKNVMHSGDLSGRIWLDSINQQAHLYGLGPTEGLGKEILVVDGKVYVSGVATDTSVIVTENSDTKAPFFVYAYPNSWDETTLLDSITTIKDIETFLDATHKEVKEPFVFRVIAQVDSAVIHIVNLHDGAVVKSPSDAHADLKQFPVANEEVEILGFFSRTHQTVFIHHDAYTHMHLITTDRKKMGHLDELHLKKGTAKLYVGVE